MSDWKRLGEVSPRKLVEARLQLHHAAQIPALAVGASLLPPEPDGSHSAMRWITGEDRWVTAEIPDSAGVRAGLRPRDLALTLERPEGDFRRLDLTRRTREEALVWLERELEHLGVDPGSIRVEPTYDIPEHRVEMGFPFDRSELPAFAELSRWYANAARAITDAVQGSAARAAPLRTWPRRLEMISTLAVDSRAGEAPRIGVGFSPGDEHSSTPYFSVSPHPSPALTDDPPRLPAGGQWRREGVLAAVLPAERAAGARDQEAAVREFLAAAIEEARTLLG